MTADRTALDTAIAAANAAQQRLSEAVTARQTAEYAYHVALAADWLARCREMEPTPPGAHEWVPSGDRPTERTITRFLERRGHGIRVEVRRYTRASKYTGGYAARLDEEASWLAAPQRAVSEKTMPGNTRECREMAPKLGVKL